MSPTLRVILVAVVAAGLLTLACHRAEFGVAECAATLAPPMGSATPPPSPGTAECLSNADLEAEACVPGDYWIPSAEFLAGLNELRRTNVISNMSGADAIFRKCYAAGDTFCVYGSALWFQALGMISDYRDLAAKYLAGGGACVECTVIVQRDLGMSWLLQEPLDATEGRRLLTAACDLATEKLHHGFYGHAHPCLLLYDRKPEAVKKRGLAQLVSRRCSDLFARSCLRASIREPEIEMIWW